MVKWLIQFDVFEENRESLSAELSNRGIEFSSLKYDPLGNCSFYDENDCVVSYVSLDVITGSLYKIGKDVEMECWESKTREGKYVQSMIDSV